MLLKSRQLILWCMVWIVACSAMTGNAWAGPPEVMIATKPLYGCPGKSSFGLAAAIEGGNGNVLELTPSSAHSMAAPTYIYRSSFHASNWSGDVKKAAISFDLDGELQMATVPNWEAANLLSRLDQSAAGAFSGRRKIYTAIQQNDQSWSTVEAKWNHLTAAQQHALNTSPMDGSNDSLGERRLDYLRGERSLEKNKTSGIFRIRESVLGDMVNSNVVYAGSPAANIQGIGYDKFYALNKRRAKAVYVGANDGMLHAFDAENGRELFSYIPNAIFLSTTQLTRPDYAHRPYVDGGMVVAEGRTSSGWKTILVSGLGGGAQGVFALDVTNPADFESGSGALWEFTDRDDSDMGNQMGMSAIGKIANGKNANGFSEYKYYVIVSSGLNNYKEDGAGKHNSDGAGALFLLSLDKAPSAKWELNVNYFKFKVPIKDPSSKNGLSAPALAIGSDGTVRYAYAGDLQGNLWRFDFNGSAPGLSDNSRSALVFSAKDARGVAQPITSQPKIVFAPGGGYVVLFGTGKFVEELDAQPSSNQQQSFYGIHDNLKNKNGVPGRSQLAARHLVKENSGALRFFGDEFLYGQDAKSKGGWYVDFVDSDTTGERSVTNSVVVDGTLFFNTLLLDTTSCEKISGRSYAVEALTGLSAGDDPTGYVSQLGMLGTPVILKMNQNDHYSGGKSSDKRKYVVVNFGTGGTKGAMSSRKVTSSLNGLNAPNRRFSWREVVNWQELRDAADYR